MFLYQATGAISGKMGTYCGIGSGKRAFPEKSPAVFPEQQKKWLFFPFQHSALVIEK